MARNCTAYEKNTEKMWDLVAAAAGQGGAIEHDDEQHGPGVFSSFSQCFWRILSSSELSTLLITMQRCGIRALATANDLIFRKAMRLSPDARGAYKTGKVLNLMQIDARRLYDTSWFWHLQWAAVVQVISSRPESG